MYGMPSGYGRRPGFDTSMLLLSGYLLGGLGGADPRSR